MKIRTDFVTNSSSSSFIIAYRDIDKHNDDNSNLYSNILNKIMEYDINETDEAHIFLTKEDFDKNFISEYNYNGNTIQEILNEDEQLKNKYNKIINYINQGFIIAKKYIGYDDYFLKNIINIISTNNNDFIVLED